MSNFRGFLNVDYDDGDASTFRGLTLTYGDKTKKFDTGNPIIDWYNYMLFIYCGEAIDENINHISCSSSIDHWFMDSNDYTEKFIKENNDGEYEFMTEEDIKFMSFSDMNKTVKCVISNDMISFKELKEYYKNYISLNN